MSFIIWDLVIQLAFLQRILMNLGDLLDDTVKHFPPVGTNVDEEDTIHVAIIGRPNVGKSSLTNALLGQDRVIVSDVAGTTRDSIDTHWTHGDQKIRTHRYGRDET